MCGTKTCEKWRFLMRKGTKMALKQGWALWLFCKVLTLQPIGINRVLERDITSLIIQYIILDKGNLWAGYWGRWRDLIAMHHFGRTDGLFAGNKSFEIVQLLCVVSVSVIVTNNRLMWQRSLFFKIALAVIIWTEKEVLFPFLFKLLLCFYKQYIGCYL